MLVLVALAAVAAARTADPTPVWMEAPMRSARSTDTGQVGSVTGAATFYAEDFHGLPMANGAPFDMDDVTITAANAWPLGTQLRVRRVLGGPWDARLSPEERAVYFGRSVVVTVTDRGAFRHPLDLSRAAFAQLGRPEEGVIQVQVEPITLAARRLQ